MRADQGQRGQAAIEWLGVVLVVVLLVGAFATAAPGLGRTVACEVRGQVAALGDGGGACATAPARTARTPGDRTAFGAPNRPRGTAAAGRGAWGSGSFGRRGIDARTIKLSWVGDRFNDLLGLLEAPELVEIRGYLVPVQLNGPTIPVKLIRKLFGLTPKAYERAAKYAKQLGLRVEVLLSSQKISAKLVGDLAGKLDPATRRRITLAVGVGKDSKGRLKLVVGTSERGGYMRPGVREALEKRGITVVRGTREQPLNGHAEQQVLQQMVRQGLKPVTVGASRPICARCAAEIRRAGGTFATPVKAPRRPPRPRR